MARKVPQNNMRLWFSQPPGQPASFTARLAPAADRGVWLRFLHATVEPMDGGSRVVGWFQVPAFMRRGLAIAVEAAILVAFLIAVETVIALIKGESVGGRTGRSFHLRGPRDRRRRPRARRREHLVERKVRRPTVGSHRRRACDRIYHQGDQLIIRQIQDLIAWIVAPR
jgi:hypothetical protein